MSAQRRPEPEDDGSHPDDAAAERIAATLGHAQRFIGAIFDNPALLDEIPEGGSVVFLPEDDPRAAEKSRAAAERMRRAGQRVYLARV